MDLLREYYKIRKQLSGEGGKEEVWAIEDVGNSRNGEIGGGRGGEY